MRSLFFFTFFAIFLLAQASLSAPIPGYFETWDNAASGTAGWSGTTAFSTTVRAGSGGNPGGYLQTTQTNASGTLDVGGGATFVSALRGDFRGSVWNITLDALYDQGSFDASVVRLRHAGDENGWVFDLPGPFTADQWISYSVTFDGDWNDAQARSAGWMPLNEHPTIPGAGTGPSDPWTTLMSSVMRTSVRISGNGSTVISGLDNFSLVPEPTTALLLAFGLAGLAAKRKTDRIL